MACKKGVFAGQEVGFCIAKVWFLFFECCVVAICLECYGNLSATFWQSVRSCRGPIYRARVHEYPEIILRIYAVGITIRIISTYQNHLGWIEERAR